MPVSAAANAGTLADIAVTPDGTLYFLYADASYHAQVVLTHNKGLTWSAPLDLTPVGVKSVGFPVIVAGDNGRIGVAFYGTSDPSMAGVNPGRAGANVKWDGYVGIVTGADTLAPTIQASQVTPPSDPLHYGCISKDGGCGGDPLAAYMDIAVGPDGRVYAIFVDAIAPGSTSHSQRTGPPAPRTLPRGRPHA